MVKWIIVCEEQRREPDKCAIRPGPAISGRTIDSCGSFRSLIFYNFFGREIFSTRYHLIARIHKNVLKRAFSCPQHRRSRWIWLYSDWLFDAEASFPGDNTWLKSPWINCTICYFDCKAVVRKATHLHPSLVTVSFVDFMIPKGSTT